MKTYINKYRLQMVKDSAIEYSTLPTTCSNDCFDILKRFLDPTITRCQEQFSILGLNTALRPIGWTEISLGGSAETTVDPKIVFRAALQGGYTKIILCHNHPSDAMKPSTADLEITQSLVKSGKLLDLIILDHIIVDSELENFYSFADNNLI